MQPKPQCRRIKGSPLTFEIFTFLCTEAILRKHAQLKMT
jgi:hypothetical protein